MTDPDARDLYLSSYLQTYIERDVRELLGIEKRREFEVFVRMCALRTAQVLNYDELARNPRIPAPQGSCPPPRGPPSSCTVSIPWPRSAGPPVAKIPASGRCPCSSGVDGTAW